MTSVTSSVALLHKSTDRYSITKILLQFSCYFIPVLIAIVITRVPSRFLEWSTYLYLHIFWVLFLVKNFPNFLACNLTSYCIFYYESFNLLTNWSDKLLILIKSGLFMGVNCSKILFKFHIRIRTRCFSWIRIRWFSWIQRMLNSIG